jgi:CRISPR-associated endonuclease Cas1
MPFDEIAAPALHNSKCQIPVITADETDDWEWAERNEFWLTEFRGSATPRGRRERAKQPLILCGHGVSLRIENGALVIRDGFTHYPQKTETHRFFRGDIAIPPRIIMLDGSGTVSFDVLKWLSEQRVALVSINWKGEVLSVIGGYGYAADRDKVRWQAETRADNHRRMGFSAGLIIRKLARSIETLEAAIPPSARRDAAINKAVHGLDQLKSNPPTDMTALRLVEATCASAYFGAWRGVEMKWKATARRPIPDDWRVFTSRASIANGAKLKNVNASHPLNAMLNYAYAALQTQLHVRAVADGFDPTLGIMHHGRRDAPAYVFDLMEPERPKVDRAVLDFVKGHVFDPADFVIRADGVCRLNPEMARVVVAGVSMVRD